jgi:hypothetical protein
LGIVAPTLGYVVIHGADIFPMLFGNMDGLHFNGNRFWVLRLWGDHLFGHSSVTGQGDL